MRQFKACAMVRTVTEDSYIDLRYLPEAHPLRNTLLVDLGAQFKHPSWDEFRPLERGRPLADNTYNTLTGAWVSFYKWRVPGEHRDQS